MPLLRDLAKKIRYGQPITVISGLPRSGTSMAMKMVEAGGREVCTDHQRTPDEDNPKGYFEVERVKNLRSENDKTWLREARGKAVKVISSLLPELPADNFYKVIFLVRDLDEVIASQNEMLERRGEPLSNDDEQIKRYFQSHLQTVRSWLKRQPNFEVLEVYREAIENPVEQVIRIQRFLGVKLHTGRMAAAIDNRLYRNRSTLTERATARTETGWKNQ